MIDAFDQRAQYYFDVAMFLPGKYQDLARAVAILREWSARSSQLVGVGAALTKKEWGVNSPESDAVVKALRLITSAYIRYKLGNRPVASVRSIERMGEGAKDDEIDALANVFGGFLNVTNLTPTTNKTINRKSGSFEPKTFSFLYHANHYNIVYVNF